MKLINIKKIKICLILTLTISFFSLLDISPVSADFNPFDLPEKTIQTSPTLPKTFPLISGTIVMSFDVNPTRPLVAMLLQAPTGEQSLVFWDINTNEQQPTQIIKIPTGIILTTIKWHPLGDTIFALGKQNNQYEILKTSWNSWDPNIIFHSNNTLEHLILGPRPFQIHSDDYAEQLNSNGNYRIFFGIKNTDGNFSTESITENGGHQYTVLTSKPIDIKAATANIDDYEHPNTLIANSALPTVFHPAGHLLIWEDAQHCFQEAHYGEENWANTNKIVVANAPICSGDLLYTPNGAALLHWQPESPGVIFIDSGNKQEKTLAGNFHFLSAPLPVADGKGIVGIVKNNNSITLQYIPVDMPLADVANAWMFLESPRDQTLFSTNSGLFRPLTDNQLYELYDSESYFCNDYTKSMPARPYYVTTDIFWELYAAAYEGIFITAERQAAIPAFWDFVQKGNAYFKSTHAHNKMADAFAAMIAIHDGNIEKNLEAEKILAANEVTVSTVTHDKFDFKNLKPRSHYTLDAELQNYFRASKYLLQIELDKADIATLKGLPQPVQQNALAWINAYKPFIAPSRAPLIWDKSYSAIPAYVIPPKNESQVFPLSWGIDNEILNHTAYHSDWPPAEQIIGPNGPRLLPSGLDIAAVMGSNFAEMILDESGEFTRYPSLKNQIAQLRTRLAQTENTQSSQENLYQHWMTALSIQWSNHIVSPDDTIKASIWQTKRLQTGLAAWATLRHATLLVNERIDAECGEGGFEPIIMQAPRGYVEPDPQTFEAIAELFDATIDWVKNSAPNWKNNNGQQTQASMQDLQTGIIRRLIESRDNVRLFRDIAQKELAGKPLNNSDYDTILHVGRAAEHNFLIFKSLAKKDLALSTPDPVAKIADVASADKNAAYLLVGVGFPLEWDQIVPFYGRKEIVKGAIYSYYELQSPQILNDEEWRKKVSTQIRPQWISPFISQSLSSYPAKVSQ